MDIEGRYIIEAVAVGEQVKKARKKRGFTQPKLSELSGIRQPQLSLIENGRSNFTFETLIKLVTGVKIATRDLFDYNEEMFKIVRGQSAEERLAIERVSFGRTVKFLLDQSDIRRQDDLAITVGMDPGDFSRFINGEHNIELINVVKIAEGLSAPLLRLFDYRA